MPKRQPITVLNVRIRFGVFFLALILYVTGGFAQQYPMRNYNIDNGLSHSNVYRIFQDHRGFLWFCTDYGICSFDGSTFNKVNNDSLLGGAIMSMSEDLQGNKLISSNKEGIILMSDSVLRKYPVPGGGLQSKVLYAVSKNGKTWAIARESGHSLYELSGETIRKINILDGSGQTVFFNKIVECGNELLFPTNNGIYEVAGATVRPFLEKIVKGAVADVKKGRDGTYWISLGSGILEVKDKAIVNRYDLKPGQVAGNILCDTRGNVWIAQYDGSMLLLHDGILEDVTGRMAMHRTLINDMLEDHEGNIWLATYDAGIYKISTLDIYNYPLEEDQLNIFCHSLDKLDTNKIVIGTMGRVIVWENGKMRPISFNSLQPGEFVYFVKSYKDKIYVGTPHGLYFKNTAPGSHSVSVPANNRGSISMCVDHDQKIWIGSFGGLFHLEGNTLVPETVPEILKKKRINAITEDHEHNIWFGTATGLVKYDRRQFRLFPLPARKNIQTIRAIYEDSHHRIWVGTEDGLICIENESFKVFTTKDGLTHNRCNTCVEDQNNILWVGTLQGLSYIDLNTLRAKRYSKGIYPSEVLSLSCNGNNMLFVGTATGLSSIKSDRLATDETATRLYITSVTTSQAKINMPERVYLAYDENKLRIDFIGLNFQNANRMEYRYKLSGLDNDWQFTDNTSIELPSLPSGKYSFVLSARKNNGEWSNETALPITVSTPFWKTWWFITALLLLTTVIIIKIARVWQASVHRKKTERLLKDLNEKLEKRAEELATSNRELEEFAYIASHDLQEPLRMVTGFLTQLETKYKNQLDDKARQYIHFATDGAVRMRGIIFDLLEYSRVGRQKGGDAPVDANELVAGAIQLNRARIEEKNALIHSKDLPVIKGSKTALQQIFPNLIGNALKYQIPGKQPVINITAQETGTHWKFCVSDNGIGIEPKYFHKIFIVFQRLHDRNEYSGTGIGLAICKKVIENHNGRIWVESEPGSGSRFYFTIAK